MTHVLGAYRPGASPLHRLPAWSKVATLIVWSAVTLLVRDPITSGGLAVAALMLLVSVLPAAGPTFKGLGMIVIVAAMASAYQVWRGDYVAAIDLGVDLIGLFALSLAITGSTPMSDMLDLATAAARPLRRVLPPAITGLMFAIMLRAIPEIAGIMRQSRDAARARGIRRGPTAFMIPTATRTVGFALDLGAALHARGIGDDAASDAPRGRPMRIAAKDPNG
ncbi:MAG: energy-coupling factor transporter transmembrane protein EcfT [Demequina sp.]|uniref:energy-coupling factor transporter transmembrane component T family protein n=1 Tax=Demequina sp. TaxID=2050685 RepID=UPI0019B1FE4E|nr:energy-coupling factor transporter transmembrane component T [Demequina sp.]MBC7297301.1 energy-coupling factor transporter transmembrane protein EcfT [Demequina sp.]